MLYFRCQSEIVGALKPFEIKFELGTSASDFCIRDERRVVVSIHFLEFITKSPI